MFPRNLHVSLTGLVQRRGARAGAKRSPGSNFPNEWLASGILKRPRTTTAGSASSKASTALKWVTGPPLYSALEQIWLRLQDEKLFGLEPLLQASELRQLMTKVRPFLERAGYNRKLSDDRHYLGESYLPVFIADAKNLLAE
jgi:hypothetical protein